MHTSSLTITATASVDSSTLDVVTTDEAAALLRCTPWPVLELVRGGRLPASRLVGDGGPWLIGRGDLAGVLAAS